ncbi:IS3 family transposase [Lysinibacillus sphaericus]
MYNGHCRSNVRDYINYYYNTRIQLQLNNQSPINDRKLVG